MFIKERKVDNKVKKEDFLKFMSDRDKESLLDYAQSLEGKKVIHFNATPVGGGVAELLKSLIPYFRSLGIDARWYTLDSSQIDDDFFEITDKMRDAFQGKAVDVTDEEWKLYKDLNMKFAEEVNEIDSDVLVVHDWQILYSGLHVDNESKIYISHPDTSSPYQKFWNQVLPLIESYPYLIFSNREFIHGDLGKDAHRVILKAIDPLSLKQRQVPTDEARDYVADYGISREGEMVLQVSRFDPWKNPSGLVEAFQVIKDDYPDAHLTLLGLQEAMDNPEAERVFEVVKDLVGDDDRINLFFNPREHNIESISEFTMYAQNAADIIIQNSIKEGFGLTVSEALWKKKPVIGGPASGVKKQIKDGWNGFIAKDKKELAKRMSDLIDHPKKRKELGENGRDYVRDNFLLPRLVEEHLDSYLDVLEITSE